MHISREGRVICALTPGKTTPAAMGRKLCSVRPSRLKFLSGIGFGKWRGRNRHAQEPAERLPAFLRIEHEQALFRNGAAHFLVMAVEDVDHVRFVETPAEGFLPDQKRRELSRRPHAPAIGK